MTHRFLIFQKREDRQTDNSSFLNVLAQFPGRLNQPSRYVLC